MLRCQKKPYRTGADARRYAKKHRKEFGRMIAYRCQVEGCGEWHVGHPPAGFGRGEVLRSQITTNHPRLK